MARIYPLRMDTKIVLQGGQYGVGLIGAERAADGEIPQRRTCKFDLDIRVAADVGKNFR